jgi:MFS family permease
MESRPLLAPLTLLRRAPGFRLLFFATFGSSLGSLLAVIALAIDVKDRTDSGNWIAALLLANLLPGIALGLTLGPLLDRLSRKRLMIAADLVRLAVFCTLPFAGSALAIVLLALVAGVALSFFRPAVYAGMPNLVESDDLPAANTLLLTVENVTWAAGPLLGGLLVAASGPDLAYWINAATFLFSAVLIMRIPARLLQSDAPISKGHWRDVAEGIGIVRMSLALVTVLVAWSLAMLGKAAWDVAEVFLAKNTFSAGDFGYGLLFGASGVGLVAGSAVVAGLVGRLRIATLYGGGIALLGLGAALVAVSPNVWVASAFAVGGGFGNGAALVCNALLVQQGSPDAVRGRAFTVIMSANYIALGLGMVAAGPFVDALGGRWTAGAAAAAYLTAAGAAWLLARGMRAERPAAPVAPFEEAQAEAAVASPRERAV